MAQGAHQKKEPLTIENEEEAQKGKESTQRNVVIHHPHLFLLHKVIHLKESPKKLVKRGKNIAVKKFHLLQMNKILKQILTPSLSK